MNSLTFYSAYTYLKGDVRFNVVTEISMLTFKGSKMYATIIKNKECRYTCYFNINNNERFFTISEDEFKAFIEDIQNKDLKEVLAELARKHPEE